MPNRLLMTSGVLAAMLFAAPPVRAESGCDSANIAIFASVEEEREACAALAEVLAYFAAGGLHVDLPLTIRFQPSVFVDAPAIGGVAAAPLPVLGRFHRRRNEVLILSSGAPGGAARKPWTLPWDARIAGSILRHEIAHAVIARLLGESYDKLPPAWHEALAYAVQIDLMTPDLRAEMLAAYPDATPFDATTKINDIAYGFDPDAFSVRAWLTFVAGGRMAFLKKALALEFEMIDLRDYFN